MPRSTDSYNDNRHASEDISSRGTTSNSDSYDTIFTQNHHLICHSPNHTTPLHSPPSSPFSCQSNTMDTDLYGIGRLEEPEGSRSLNPTTLSLFERSQQFPSNSMVNFHNLEGFQSIHPSLEESPLEKTNIAATYQGCPVTTLCGSWDIARGPSPSTTYKLPSPDIYNVYKTPSSSGTFPEDGDLDEDVDLDLEKSAEDSLSRWFGISLQQLRHPTRILYAFEYVKEECASILRNEGHNTTDAQSNDDESEDIQIDPCDAGESSRPTHGTATPSRKVDSPSSHNKKQLRDGISQQSSSPEGCTTYKKRNKRPGVLGQLSCPYRKRNPIRFNVRQHEKCANTSYPDMPSLKKHLTSCHLKDCPLICNRCHEEFTSGHFLNIHSRRCPYPLPEQHQTDTEYSDPEDGIDEGIEERLRSRGRGKIEDWVELYKVVFPLDDLIPDPEFIPVVEDYEVFNEYERTRPSLAQHIDELVSRRSPSFVADGGSHLKKGILDLFHGSMLDILKRPMHTPGTTQSPQSNYLPAVQRAQHLGSEFRHGMQERDEIDDAVDTFSTPQYISSDDSQDRVREEPSQYPDGSHQMDFPLVYPDQQMTGDILRQLFAAERSNPLPRTDSQPSHFGTTEAGTVYWPYPYQNYGQNTSLLPQMMPLPHNLHPPATNGSELPADFWMSGGNYEFQASNCESMDSDSIL